MSEGQKHRERHFMQSETVHDIVIGMSDGFTVPFAIAAGVSGASVASHVVIIAGLSEIAAGAISMGLGGYLSGRTDIEHYDRERQREIKETEKFPDTEKQEVSDILHDWGLDDKEAQPVVEALSQNREKWVDFMMRFELGLERPTPRTALLSALRIGGGYALAGFVPLAPYFGVSSVQTALFISAGVTMLAMFVLGYIKGLVTGITAWRSGLQTMLLGGVAAGAAYGISRLVGG